MIIKSMSRKEATFSQLVDYFEDGRQDEKFTVYHNVYSNNPESIKEEFNKNATFIKQRTNGVFMYHEVLSITKSTVLTEDQQKEILKDIALNYVKSRAKNNLVYGVLHHDKKDNLHYHFMISANEFKSDKKHRLSKEEFSTFKKNLESYVLECYPELEQKKLINKESSADKNNKEKISNKEFELKRRTGKTSQKDNVKERLRTVFAETKTKTDFFNTLERENLEIYVHGNTIGILDKVTDRKHRLKTLGLLDEFNVISSKLEEIEHRKAEVNYNRNEFSKERVNTTSYRSQQDYTPKEANQDRSKSHETEINAEVEQEISKRKEEIKKSRDDYENDYDNSRSM